MFKKILLVILEVAAKLMRKEKEESSESEAKAARDAIGSVKDSYKKEAEIKEKQDEVSDDPDIDSWNNGN